LSCWASCFPKVDFPEPGIPTKTIFKGVLIDQTNV
jgi:hypothetical protein